MLQTSDGRLAMHVFPQHSLTEMSYFKKTTKYYVSIGNRKLISLRMVQLNIIKPYIEITGLINMNFKTLK